MKKTKMEKGITLIALIITIVVLLILAVVTIGTIRESSIITHAQNAKEGWKKGQTQEELELKLAELKIDMGQNSSNYEFKIFTDDAYEENDIWFENDDGSLSNIFNSVDITIASSQLTSDGKYKFNQGMLNVFAESVENETGDTEYYILNYNILCVDKNNEEIMLNIKFTGQEYETDEEYYLLCKMTDINVLGELGKTINTMNEKVINNPSDYQLPGKDGDGILNIIYTALINENITIESTELLNSEKNGFSIEVFGDENNSPVEHIGGTAFAFDCNCSKDGETFTLRPVFGYDYDDDARAWITEVRAFLIK